MNILITGCFGFIGSNLTIHALNAGHRVIGFDNLSNPSLDPTDRIKQATKNNWNNLIFYKCDITNLDQMISILANHPIDAIVNLAAMGSIPKSFAMPTHTLMNNVIGFSQIVQLTNMLQIKRLVFASSSSVYGKTDENPRKEGHEGRLLNPYALSKRINEELGIMLINPNTSFFGLRFFNVYGPGQSFNSNYSAVIPKFCTEENPIVNGDGEIIRDFTFVDDVCDAIMRCLYKNGGFILNIGTGKKTTLNELLEILNKKDQAKYERPRYGDVLESYADVGGAERILGFKANTDILDGLLKTKAYYDEYMKQQEKLSSEAVRN